MGLEAKDVLPCGEHSSLTIARGAFKFIAVNAGSFNRREQFTSCDG